ncbi:hypothetical protein AB0N09_40065 [Streptomyces erythrochromogenes]|uniref:hypothetical protein n=1 Tax=Streptomyces erythrochromogenes TaxID=285574 RepID=UPI0034461CAC
MPAVIARSRARRLPAPRRPERPPGGLLRHALAVVVAADDSARVVLLAGHASGAVRIRRARSWPPDAAPAVVLAALAGLYRAGADRAPTAVHVSPGGGRPWLALVRRSVGPLAELTVHSAAAPGWPDVVAMAMAALGADPAGDPEYVAVLAEHAIRRAARE